MANGYSRAVGSGNTQSAGDLGLPPISPYPPLTSQGSHNNTSLVQDLQTHSFSTRSPTGPLSRRGVSSHASGSSDPLNRPGTREYQEPNNNNGRRGQNGRNIIASLPSLDSPANQPNGSLDQRRVDATPVVGSTPRPSSRARLTRSVVRGSQNVSQREVFPTSTSILLIKVDCKQETLPHGAKLLILDYDPKQFVFLNQETRSTERITKLVNNGWKQVEYSKKKQMSLSLKVAQFKSMALENMQLIENVKVVDLICERTGFFHVSNQGDSYVSLYDADPKVEQNVQTMLEGRLTEGQAKLFFDTNLFLLAGIKNIDTENGVVLVSDVRRFLDSNSHDGFSVLVKKVMDMTGRDAYDESQLAALWQSVFDIIITFNNDCAVQKKSDSKLHIDSKSFGALNHNLEVVYAMLLLVSSYFEISQYIVFHDADNRSSKFASKSVQRVEALVQKNPNNKLDKLSKELIHSFLEERVWTSSGIVNQAFAHSVDAHLPIVLQQPNQVIRGQALGHQDDRGNTTPQSQIASRGAMPQNGQTVLRQTVTRDASNSGRKPGLRPDGYPSVHNCLNAQQGKASTKGLMYPSFQHALAEVKNGLKETHWIGYVFPTLPFPNSSIANQTFSLGDLPEAEYYLENADLKNNYMRIVSETAQQLARKNLSSIFGDDAEKVRDSMDLFAMAARRNSKHKDLFQIIYNCWSQPGFFQ